MDVTWKLCMARTEDNEGSKGTVPGITLEDHSSNTNEEKCRGM